MVQSPKTMAQRSEAELGRLMIYAISLRLTKTLTDGRCNCVSENVALSLFDATTAFVTYKVSRNPKMQSNSFIHAGNIVTAKVS